MDDIFQMYRAGVTYLPSDVSYFDELLLLSPKSAGLEQLPRNCSDCGLQYDVLFNFKQS